MADAARRWNATGRAPRHQARHFAALPSVVDAIALLHEIANTPCDFAPVAPDRPIALYGAGNLGRLARDFLRAVGHDFALVIDRNAESFSADPAWAGVPVIHPDQVSREIKADYLLAVSIATSPYVPLEQALEAQGFAHIVPFYDLAESFSAQHPLSNGWFADPLTNADIAAITEVLAGFADDLSRAHHLQFLAWRCLRQEWTFEGAPVTGHDRFFIPEVKSRLTHEERFLDGGAHFGSVTMQFLETVENRFESVVALEPDDQNRAVLSDVVHARPKDPQTRISISSDCLDATSGQRAFSQGLGYASQLSDIGQSMIQTRSIDDLHLAPSFIKLHLEGAELAALHGGLQTLREHRPILCVTTYHNGDGLWQTPAFLMQYLSDYRILTRLHSWCGTGAVVYAIPQERLTHAA